MARMSKEVQDSGAMTPKTRLGANRDTSSLQSEEEDAEVCEEILLNTKTRKSMVIKNENVDKQPPSQNSRLSLATDQKVNFDNNSGMLSPTSPSKTTRKNKT